MSALQSHRYLPSSTNPARMARLAGILQLCEGTLGAYGQVYSLGVLVVSRDAVATAANFTAHTSQVYVAFACSVAAVFFHVAWAHTLYRLLCVVQPVLSKFALQLMLVGCALQSVAAALVLAPLVILETASTDLAHNQVAAIAYFAVRLNAMTFHTYLVFFGLWTLITGMLIYRSTFLPKALGLAVSLAGLAWMLHLVPPVAREIGVFILAASAIGEIPMMVWLLWRGVDTERWLALQRVGPQ